MRNFSQPLGFTTGVGAEAALELDARLMQRLRAGDAASFEQILARHRRPVVRFLGRMVGDQAVAEELAQEVFLRVYRARDSYEPTAKFTTWLYRIATRLALNALRDGRSDRFLIRLDGPARDDGRNGTRWEATDLRATCDEEMLAAAQAETVRRAVESLPPKQRAAVLMHKYEGLDYRRIAEALDCSAAAVKSLLFRAYETLRTELAEMGRGSKKGRAQ